jgi:Cyclin, N-terminal domain
MCTSSPSALRARLDRKEYQLVALTTLYIATKIFEPFAMDASLVSRLSRGLHSTEEIIALEYEILLALQWKVNGKLAHSSTGVQVCITLCL